MKVEELEHKARVNSLVYDTKYAEDGVLEEMLSRPQDFVDGAIMEIVQLLREKANRDGFIAGAKELQEENEQLKAQIEQLQKINNEQRETLKKVRVALIQERTANIMNYGKGGVEMVDDMFEILKGVTN